MSLVAPDLAAGFRQAAVRWPAHTALELGGSAWTYTELAAVAGRIAAAVRVARDPARDTFVAVLASRSLTTYAGSLAVFGAGCAHVALNPTHPPTRNARALDMAEAGILLVDDASLPALSALLQCPEAAGIHTVIAPESDSLDGRVGGRTGLRLLTAGDVAGMDDGHLNAPTPGSDELAYLVFTSGSTGRPKGIAIDHGALATYMRNFRALAAPADDDRVATTYELTFDIALHDMFHAWWSGAALCVVPKKSLVAPGRFIKKQKITHWFSVASVAMLLDRQRVLRDGVFPDLRVSLLCGEPLPVRSAERWSAAAPNSVLYNVYGPTETTMEMAFYRWDPVTSPPRQRRGVVAIGIPFDDHQHVMLDSDGQEVVGEGRGELYIAGPQLAVGYWKDEKKTAESFVMLPGRNERWYRTRDLVERDEEGVYHFVSRTDHMVKLRGHRIELGEIEAGLRLVAGTDLVAVLPHPIEGGNAQGLVAFVAGSGSGPDALRDALGGHIPESMIPDRIVMVDQLPLNSNRKIDRGALKQRLDAEGADT